MSEQVGDFKIKCDEWSMSKVYRAPDHHETQNTIVIMDQ